MKNIYAYCLIGLLLSFPSLSFAQVDCINAQPTAHANLNTISINSNGISRSFYVYTPPRYNALKQTKVVFMFHGTGQDGLKMFQKTKWKDEADRENFLLVLPNSLCYFLIDEQVVKSRWNDGNLKIRQTATPANDVLFFRDMLNWVEEYKDSLNVDHHSHSESKIFIAGFSNGSIFCSKLLMEAADAITAAGIVSTLLPNTTVKQPAKPVPTMVFYGTEDQRVLDTLHIVSGQFPSTPNLFRQTPLFEQIIKWHLLRNGLNKIHKQISKNGNYSLIFNAPSNKIADNRKYFEVRVYEGLIHNYPANDIFPYWLNTTSIFNRFFNHY